MFTQTLCARTSLVLILALMPAFVLAEDIPRDQHPWGRFAPGSWARIKITTEKISAAGKKTAQVTLVTTRLLAVDEHGVTLQTETRQGQDVTKGPEITTNWDGTHRDGKRNERLSLGEVKFKGRSHSCQTHSVTRTIGDQTVSTKSWYSPDTPPYYLKRLIRVRGPQPRHTAIDVVTLNTTRNLDNKKYTGWETRTVIASRGGRSRSISFHSFQVPGGLVQSEGEKHDVDNARAGRQVERLDAFHAIPVSSK